MRMSDWSSDVCSSDLAANAIEAAPIIVDAPGLATVPPPEVAAAAIRRTPGGVDLVPATVYLDGHAVNLHDMLAFSPGVFAQGRYDEEARLSIRGSGIGRGFHLPGVTLLMDSAPVKTADGSGAFQESDPLMLSHQIGKAEGGEKVLQNV